MKRIVASDWSSISSNGQMNTKGQDVKQRLIVFYGDHSLCSFSQTGVFPEANGK